MSVSVQVTMNPVVSKRAAERMEANAEQAIELLTIHAAREATRLTSKRYYPPASSPGQPPAYRTGDLSDGILDTVEVVDEGDEFVGYYGTDQEYGVHLELGTSKMAARPFLRPALDRTRRSSARLLREAFSGV